MSDTLQERLAEALGGAYELERELTGGGMSRVFAARERALGRRVVVKVLPPELAAGVNRERFEREIQLAAQLQHPHIVTLLSAGEHGELLWYTMPFIEGESLREAIARRGALPVRDVLRLLGDVAEALAYAHGRGVIHRDIKPANVMVQGSHALVTDFGVAKAISAALPLPGAGMTSTGMAIGTPAYMAPEQLAADPRADHRVDLYALGLLGYEMLSGQSPFASSSPQETLAAQLTKVPEPIGLARPDVPPALAALLARCLEKVPDRRPATAAEVAEALEAIPMPSGDTVRLAAPGRRAVPWLALLGVAVAATAVAVVVRGRSAAPVDAGPTAAVAGDTGRGVSVPLVPPPTPAAPKPAPRQLTRDDSLAIAAALIRRERELAAADAKRDLDSLRRAVRQAFADSVARAMPAPPTWTREQQRLFSDSIRRSFTVLTDSLSRLPGNMVVVRRGPDGTPDTIRFGPQLTRVRTLDPGRLRRLILLPFSARGNAPAAGPLVMPLRDSLAAQLQRRTRLRVLGPADLERAGAGGEGGPEAVGLLFQSLVQVRGWIVAEAGGVRLRARVDDPTRRGEEIVVESDPMPADSLLAELGPYAERLSDAVLRLAAWTPDVPPQPPASPPVPPN